MHFLFTVPRIYFPDGAGRDVKNDSGAVNASCTAGSLYFFDAENLLNGLVLKEPYMQIKHSTNTTACQAVLEPVFETPRMFEIFL
jgi:hypothetical protein